MKDSKLLTVAIPAYNVEQFLEDTVESVAKSRYTDLIEILIINDGSKDDTKKIAENLEEKYDFVKAINKKNGGHGSTINKAIEVATGKYFRLLDGDDWYDTDEFDVFLNKLKKEESDLVLTDYIEIFLKSGLNRPVTFYSNLPEYTTLELSKVLFYSWGPMLPNTTIKTSLLKQAGFLIDEHCFYVDQEYNLLCYISAKTVSYYPLMIYRYRLEREGQSMEKSSLIRNVYSHEKVCVRLLKEYTHHKNELSDIQCQYLENKVIIPMCNMQYVLAIDYCKSRKAFLSFDKKLKKYSDFYNEKLIAGNMVKMHRKTQGLLVKFFNHG